MKHGLIEMMASIKGTSNRVFDVRIHSRPAFPILRLNVERSRIRYRNSGRFRFGNRSHLSARGGLIQPPSMSGTVLVCSAMSWAHPADLRVRDKQGMGSGNQYLTAVGGGFIPGAVVLWNGVPRTTTYIDASHLQFAVAAADVAASQAVSLTAENPGSGASPSLTLPIN
jgi:hypothetical protein